MDYETIFIMKDGKGKTPPKQYLIRVIEARHVTWGVGVSWAPTPCRQEGFPWAQIPSLIRQLQAKALPSIKWASYIQYIEDTNIYIFFSVVDPDPK